MRAAFGIVLSMLAAGALPALAGNVYIPLESNVGIDGAGYVTKVWVTNPDSATHHFTTTFIQEGTSGTAGQASSANVFVPPNGTAVLAGIAPGGQTGLLEIDAEAAGASVLVAAARLEVTNSDGTLLGFTTVPAISQDTMAPAGSFVELLGLQRGFGGALTDFSLVNLGTSSSTCLVGAFDANANLLAPVSSLSLAALSRRDFGDVLALLGAVSLGDARIEATCDQPFYTFATVYVPGTGPIAFISPSPSLAGTVTKGSGGGGGGGNGNLTFSVPGTFLNATANNSEQLYPLPAPVGVAYKRATFDWDMFIGVFPSGLFTGVMAFRRPNSQRALREPFCAVQIVNRNSKTILDLGIENVFARTQGPWKQSSTYHLQLIYDLTINQCQLNVSQGGTVIYTIAGPAQWFDMSATAANPLEIDFGQTGIGDGAYYPPVTWSFSNLNAVLEPK
jgi:hypothetical protein